MGRRRTNARPSRNELRDLHRLREQIAYGDDDRVGQGTDDRDDLDSVVSDIEDPEEAAAAEIAAFLASQDA